MIGRVGGFVSVTARHLQGQRDMEVDISATRGGSHGKFSLRVMKIHGIQTNGMKMER